MRYVAVLVLWLAAAPASAADLSDVETFLGETAFDEVQVSPDGSLLAFVTRRNDFAHDREELGVWTLDLAVGQRAARPVRLLAIASCSGLRWSPDGRWLSFLSAADPRSGLQLFVVSPAPGKAARRLTEPERFQDGIDLYDWLPDSSGLVVEATDSPPGSAGSATAGGRARRDFYGDVRRLPGPPPSASLSRISLTDGRVERLATAPFEEPGALAVSPDGSWLAIAGSGLREMVEDTEVALLPLASQPATGAAATSGAVRRTHNLVLEDRLWWAGERLFASGMGEGKDGRYTATEPRLYRVDTGPADDLRLLRVAPSLAGSVGEMVPLADGSLLTVTTVSTRMRISLVDAASGAVRTLRDQRGWIANLAAARSGERIAFAAGDAHRFAEIYVADARDGVAGARAVTDFNATLTRGPLPDIETVSWDGGDGVTVEGVLFWPPGRRGERGLPLIVDLHGGPFGVARIEAVDLFGSSTSYPVLLAARGFLVLNPNYRGSGGRGDEFTRGIEGHRCSRPSLDVIRGVESLAARGWADRERVGLIGYSGGGGLSKCLIGRTDLFRAAATGAGVWDDISLFGTVRGGFWAEVFYESKSPWEDPGLWWNESPIGSLGRVKTPTLIVAGERDGTSPAQASELYHDLVWRGVPAELLLFPDESHIFTKPSHNRTKIRAEISWLEHYLLGKPREEP
ncbi:MAG TPA: prolyl oligopeptidase family serine peptidase [Thermoanaerobaculia bacterium]|jgi:dipeptidyl aminopeptidase/acylaminoacyl peptidase|nr:prolyl oligopeptidase family serine peptidase [Thermoanaerobaculia bacterium]